MTLRNAGRYAIIGVLFLGFVVACATLTKTRLTGKERGIIFSHATHADSLGCEECHDTSSAEAIIPNHDICSACHDIDTDNPTAEQCGMCHAREDYSFDARSKILSAEVKFSHDPHIAKEIECAVCHENPDERPLPKQPTMEFCMDCHGKTDPKLNECSVCHSELSKTTVPKTRGGVRILHDAPEIWARQHGNQAQIDPAYCALCHDTETSCEECHRKNPPQNHTVSWRRQGHGFHATMDRTRCAVCHEEDSCLKCHQNTRPSSHRGSWGEPLNRHCVTCHYPPERSNCTVCHESVEHKSANASPHDLGWYPGQCGICHPGGVPYRAPHPLNSTVGCKICH